MFDPLYNVRLPYITEAFSSADEYRAFAADMLEHMKTRNAEMAALLGKRELQLMVSEPCLKLVCSSDDPGRPYLVLREIRMVAVLHVFDFDRQLAVVARRIGARVSGARGKQRS